MTGRRAFSSFQELTGKEPRPGQEDLYFELAEAIFRGITTSASGNEEGKNKESRIALCSPPGTGKSLVVYAALKAVGAWGLVSTYTRQLQGQYRDITGLHYLMGRRNYICPRTRTTTEIAPCVTQDEKCSVACIFRRARESAKKRKIVVLNHALYYTLRRFYDPLAFRTVLAMDECQRAIDAFVGLFCLGKEYEEAVRLVSRYQITSRALLLKSGLKERDFALASRYLAAQELSGRYPRYFNCQDGIRITNPAIILEKEFLSRVTVFVSATVPKFILDTCDEVIDSSSPYPVSQRPIFFASFGSMNRVNFPQFVPLIISLTSCLSRLGPGIVHVHNTEASHLLKSLLVYEGVQSMLAVGQDRERTIRKFVRVQDEPVVLIGPGLSDGLDVPNIRWQIFAKVPWPDLSESHPIPPEQEAAIRLAQAYGRAPRHPGQRCVSFVLDEQFNRIFPYLPTFAREAVIRIDKEVVMGLIGQQNLSPLLC